MSHRFKKPVQRTKLAPPPEPEVIELSEEEQAYLNERSTAVQNAKDAFDKAQAEYRGALGLISFQRHLKGHWDLTDDNAALIRQPEPQKVADPAQAPAAK